MDRRIVYNGQIPLETDLLATNRQTMIAIGYALQAALGTNTLADGLACTPTSPASMSVNVGPGSILSVGSIDPTAYSSLAADARTILKQGISLDTINFPLTAPATVGQSVVYLIEAAYQDADANSVTLPYYNASNPSQAYSGPNNSGVAQYTTRQGKCLIQVKTGTAATTGSQVTPTPDAGFTSLYAVTVANGQTTITSGNIAVVGSPFVGTKLTGKADIAALGALAYLGAGNGLFVSGGLLNTSRPVLTANRIYYVRTDGSDSNTGLANTAGGAFLTLQRAADAVRALDLAGFSVTIQVADGTYTGGVTFSAPVNGTVTLQGNPATPGNCYLNTAADCIRTIGGAVISVLGFRLQSASGSLLVSTGGCQVLVTGGMNFGPVASGVPQLYAVEGGLIGLFASYTISGGGGSHLYALRRSQIYSNGAYTVTLTGTPAYSNTFAYAVDLGLIFIPGSTYSGAATGSRYYAATNAVINTSGGGANYFPGNAAGAVDTKGGQYA